MSVCKYPKFPQKFTLKSRGLHINLHRAKQLPKIFTTPSLLQLLCRPRENTNAESSGPRKQKKFRHLPAKVTLRIWLLVVLNILSKMSQEGSAQCC